MKFFLPTALIISFVSIAVFGFAAMDHGNGDHSGCVASTAKAINCSGESGALAFIGFHFGAFKNFSTATFSGMSSVFLLLSVLVFAILLKQSGNGFISIPIARYDRAQFSSVQKERLTRWLAFHENSPSLI